MSTYPGPVTVGIHQVVREIGVIRECLIVTASHLPLTDPRRRLAGALAGARMPIP